MVLSLISRSSQDGISKSNTAPLNIIRKIKIIKNSYLYEKEIFSSLSLKLKPKTLNKNYLRTNKTKSTFNTEDIQFIPELDLYPNYVYVYCA